MITRENYEAEQIRQMSFLRTFTGRDVYPLEMTTGDININDIAHALSNQCRYAGHSKVFYSVAQHCVLVANYLHIRHDDDELAFAGLLHDAAEAYLTDMPTPIKRLMPEYGKAEDRIQRVVEETFQLQYRLDEALIHDADMKLLATEARDLMGDPQNWKSLRGLVPLMDKVRPVEASQAKIMFIEMYEKLYVRRMQ